MNMVSDINNKGDATQAKAVHATICRWDKIVQWKTPVDQRRKSLFEFGKTRGPKCERDGTSSKAK